MLLGNIHWDIDFPKSAAKIQQKMHIRKKSGVFFANRIKFYVLWAEIGRICLHKCGIYTNTKRST